MLVKKMTILTFIVFIALTISCSKNNEKESSFPAETQQGKNTLGCYVDGNPFYSATNLFGLVNPINVYYYKDSFPLLYSAGYLSVQGIDARYDLAIAGNIVIHKKNIFAVGEYPLVSQSVAFCNQNRSCDYTGYYNSKSGKSYSAESGKLILTKLDTVNKIVSGRFYFTAKDSLGNKIQVTNGRFDAKYPN